MEVVDIAGHVCYAFIMYGLLLLNAKNKWGWILRFIGELGWCVLGFILGMSSIWAWGFVFMALDIRGFIKWHCGNS